MSYLEYRVKTVPTGFRKLYYLNWPLLLLIISTAAVGVLMLYSVAGGSFSPWAGTQINRFAAFFVLMMFISMMPIWFWRNLSFIGYAVALVLLVLVEFIGTTGMGAQRWIDLGFMRLQPSELTKIGLVMMLAFYYDRLPLSKISHPLWVLFPIIIILVPTAMVLRQPDLGTALRLLATGGTVMFLAGVHWAYFATVVAGVIGLVASVFQSRGTSWQMLADYQFRRIDTFLNPAVIRWAQGITLPNQRSRLALADGPGADICRARNRG